MKTFGSYSGPWPQIPDTVSDEPTRWEIDPEYAVKWEPGPRLGQQSPCCGAGIVLRLINVAPRSPDPDRVYANAPLLRELPCCERCGTVLRRKTPDKNDNAHP
jgi:hypothetical protein